MQLPARFVVPLCLAATWLIWGSTYLGIRFALESFPPFILSGTRYLLAGAVLLAIVKLAGAPWPSRRQLGNTALLGFMMLTIGNGLVCVAEQTVPSGAAALIVAATPLLTVLANQALGSRARGIEWAGLGLGVAGIVLINLDASLAGDPRGFALVIAACLSWAIASALMPRLDLPEGPMSAALQMLAGGLVALPAALLSGERFPAAPTPAAIGALLYLAAFGSIVAYSAFVWLLRNVRPALATSSCYVNPVVALFLGWSLGNEAVGWPLLAGIAVILAGVALIGWAAARRGV
ncbi:drug/metabolite exporter YedA [Chitinimonas koreensis]|uniref:drug/metabolite exporter YedA n=1 Tax=Chitinimonas koreensis TaxID=356302 RepID=UPI0003FAC9F7|nr:drug/metabolite exporter YedA [Chitinimonas koreensis]QNM96278.1 drug/metabolite exporter YedA [Chitinimonas koreensis]